MELLFVDQRLQRIAESAVRSDAEWGSIDAAIVRQRICELMAADNLAIAASIPTLDLQRSSGHKSNYEIRLRERLRLTFEVADAASTTSNGDVDLTSVAAIRILAIENADEP